MRVVDYLRLSWREVRRQPVRSTLTLIALAVSTAVLVTLGGLSLGAQQAVISAMSPDNSLTTILVTSNKTGTNGLFGNVQTAGGENTLLNDDSVAKLRAVPNVQFVSPRAHIWEFNTFIIEGNTKQFVAQTEVVPGETAQTMPLLAGQHVATGNEVVLGAAYAREIGANPASLLGKKITITTQKGYRGEGANIPNANATLAAQEAFNQQTTELTANVVGVTTDGSNQSSVFIPLDWGKQVRTAQYWEAPGKLKKVDQFAETGYTSMVVRAASTEAVPGVATAIENLGYGQISTLAVVQKLMSISTIMWVVLGAVALVSLLAASLGIVNTMLMMVSEQRYVIGVWRACGARRSHIAMQFLLQAGLLGLGGGLIGAAVGYAANEFVGQRIAELLQAQNLAVIHIPAAPWWLLAGAVGLTVVFAVLAGLYPAARAARQDPSTALSVA